VKLPVVIGYGNPLRQDDGMGWRAAQLIEQALAPGAARITQCHELTPELAANLDGASMVILLDAAVDERPGETRCRMIHGTEGAKQAAAWSHALSPHQLVGLADQVNGSVAPVFLISGGVLSVDYGENLTPVAAECAERMAGLALELLGSMY
jgi:hydrogenase maturation protease